MSDEPTTVSWKVIEPKWKVLSADGNEIGEVYLTVGDENADIFDGLAITHHGGPALLHDYTDRPRYVSADQVASIQEGVVRLTITDEESRHLPEHQAPESAEILPESASSEGPHRDRHREALGRAPHLLATAKTGCHRHCRGQLSARRQSPAAQAAVAGDDACRRATRAVHAAW